MNQICNTTLMSEASQVKREKRCEKREKVGKRRHVKKKKERERKER